MLNAPMREKMILILLLPHCERSRSTARPPRMKREPRVFVGSLRLNSPQTVPLPLPRGYRRADGKQVQKAKARDRCECGVRGRHYETYPSARLSEKKLRNRTAKSSNKATATATEPDSMAVHGVQQLQLKRMPRTHKRHRQSQLRENPTQMPSQQTVSFVCPCVSPV